MIISTPQKPQKAKENKRKKKNNASSSNKQTTTTTTKSNRADVTMSFMIGSILFGILLAFTLGTTTKLFLEFQHAQQQLEEQEQQQQQQRPMTTTSTSTSTPTPTRPVTNTMIHDHDTVLTTGTNTSSDDSGDDDNDRPLPHPALAEGKELPNSFYTGKEFGPVLSRYLPGLYKDMDTKYGTSGTAGTDEDAEVDEAVEEVEEGECLNNDQCVDSNEDTTTTTTAVEDDEDDDDEEDEEEEDDELFLPAGQHLLLDIKNVKQEFLQSELLLAEAMLTMVAESRLTLLSYHCHRHAGVSCVAVLLESHVAFHTNPKEGLILIDLFTCGSGLLVPLVPLVTRLFAVPEEEDSVSVSSTVKSMVVEPLVSWAHKLRGFRDEDFSSPLTRDLGVEFLSSLPSAYKKEVISVQTNFQQIDIWEETNYETPLHPLTQKTVFLDGVEQSSSLGNEAYHEALVQPGMFTHSNPKRVGIIGGGEGATLREVLKHKSVTHVKMIEIDEEMVKVSREYLPEWNDCSDFNLEEISSSVSSSHSNDNVVEWCGDDERADLRYEDALAWFNDRYADDVIDDSDEESFDVLIMDALDPQDDVPFAEVLYTNTRFFKSLFNALSDDGLIVLQLGSSPSYESTPERFSKNSRRDYLINNLSKVGFQSIHIYDESHTLFGYPWSFVIAMKDYNSKATFFKNTAEINIAIHERIIKSKSGSSLIKYFDGAIMKGYQTPHKVFESAFCKQDPKPSSCGNKQQEVFNNNKKKVQNVSTSTFEVKLSSIGDGSGRGLFTPFDIQKGTMIGMEENTKKVAFYPSTLSLIYDLLEKTDFGDDINLDVMENYFEGYGWQTTALGEPMFFVDSSIETFCNHGCDGTYNIHDEMNESTESSFNLLQPREVYDVFLDRHWLHEQNQPSFALRDIKAGEEILCNYLSYTEIDDELVDDAKDIEMMCRKERVGLVTEKEGN